MYEGKRRAAFKTIFFLQNTVKKRIQRIFPRYKFGILYAYTIAAGPCRFARLPFILLGIEQCAACLKHEITLIVTAGSISIVARTVRNNG